MANIAIDPSTSINSAVTHGISNADALNFILVTEGAWVLTSAASFHAINLTGVTSHSIFIDGTVGSTGGVGGGSGIVLTAGTGTIAIGQSGSLSAPGTAAVIAGNADITNAGTIFASTGLTLGGSINSIVNSALIRATFGSAIAFTSGVAGANTIVNAGTISSDVFAISGNAQDDTITNTGLIDGRIDLGAGTNNFINEGTIDGDISGGIGIDVVRNLGFIRGGVALGSGADRYDGRGGQLTSVIDGGAGNDTIIGGDGVDLVFGGVDDDTIDLGGGDDTFLPTAGSDGDDFIDGGLGIDTYDAVNATAGIVVDLAEGLASGASIGTDQLENLENVLGSAFIDTLIGNELANILKGLAGIDGLIGAAGRDTLDGGDGADTITGGAGRDLLYGGGADGDADKFDFNSVAESGITGATRDRIVDFEDGFDKIDVSTIDAKTFQSGNQAFSFIGGGAFTSAGGQVRAFVNTAGNTVVEFNTDHDKAAEMSLVVLGTPALSGADFIL